MCKEKKEIIRNFWNYCTNDSEPIVFGEDTKYYCYPPVVYCCYVIYCYTTVTHRVYGGQLINGVSAQVYLTVGPVGSLNQPVVT